MLRYLLPRYLNFWSKGDFFLSREHEVSLPISQGARQWAMLLEAPVSACNIGKCQKANISTRTSLCVRMVTFMIILSSDHCPLHMMVVVIASWPSKLGVENLGLQAVMKLQISGCICLLVSCLWL